MLELQIGTVGFVPSFVKYCKVTIMGNLKFRFKTRAKQINTEVFFFHVFLMWPMKGHLYSQ